MSVNCTCKHTCERAFSFLVVMMLTLLFSLKCMFLVCGHSKVNGISSIFIICEMLSFFSAMWSFANVKNSALFTSQSSGNFWQTVVLVLTESPLLHRNLQHQDWLPLNFFYLICEAVMRAFSRIFTVDMRKPESIGTLGFGHTNQFFLIFSPYFNNTFLCNNIRLNLSMYNCKQSVQLTK